MQTDHSNIYCTYNKTLTCADKYSVSCVPTCLYVLVSVSLRAYLRNHTPKLQQFSVNVTCDAIFRFPVLQSSAELLAR